MILGLVQMLCEKGAIGANLARIEREIERAESLGAEVLALPEMSITGYADPGRYPDAVISLDGPEVARFLGLTTGRSVAVLGGLIEANPDGNPFITHLVARDGELLTRYRKRTIVDEECDWFSAGDEAVVFEQAGVTYGLAICADIESETVFSDAWEEGAEVILHVAAPGLYDDQDTRNWQSGYDWWEGLCNYHLGDYSRNLGCWIAVATQAGRTVDEDFPGGAFLFDPSGRRLYGTPDWHPCSVYLDIDLDRQTADVVAEVRDGL